MTAQVTTHKQKHRRSKMKKEKKPISKRRRIIRTVALSLIIAFFASILIQFGYNMLFVKPIAYETTKGGDGKLTEMLYQSESLPDEYFEDVALMRKYVGKDVKVKAAGGIASFDDAKKFIQLGADRLGTSRLIKIMKM